MRELLRKVRHLFSRRKFENELEQELQFHLEMAREEQGSTAAFGSVQCMREGSREMWTFRWLENLWRDLRYAGRVLRKSPGSLRIPLLGGRTFTQADGPQAAKVVVVNEACANLYFPRRNPMGMHIKSGNDDLEIAGLVGNVPMQGTSVGGYAPLAAVPVVYFPVTQEPGDLLRMAHMWFSPSWIVRTSAPPEAVMRGMQRAMQSVEPLLPFSAFRELSEVKSKTLGSERLETTLMGTMAALALLLAAIGIYYGLIAHSVSERTRELGIRMAMGATAGQAVSLMTMPGVVLAGIGCALGCVLAWGEARLMRQLIWGVSPTDAATFVGVALLFLLVAAIASVLPAWRITRLNPANTLRSE